MVETNSPEYWEALSKKGEIDGEISIEVEIIMKEYAKTNPEIFFYIYLNLIYPTV